MRKLTTTLIIVFSLIWISCGDKDLDNTNVTLNFKLEYEGQPLAGFGQVSYPLGYDVFFSKFSMFLTDAVLMSDSNSEPLFDVIFVDLLKNISDPTTAAAGVSVTLSGIAAGTYQQLKFNLGVDPSDNAKRPSDFPNDNALANNSEYWVGWSSYIFHKIEGKIDAENNGNFDTNVALHIGSDDAFRQRTINKQITIIEGQNNTIQLTIDLGDALDINGTYFDLLARPQVHSEEVLPEVLPIMDSLIDAIK